MHLRRTAVAVTAAAAVVLGPIAVGTAEAKPPAASGKVTKGKSAKVKAAKAKKAKVTKARKAKVKQLVHDVAVKDGFLARTASSATVVGLADDHEAVLVDAISQDRAALAAIRDAGIAAPVTAAAARVTVRTFRVEVYVEAAGIVRDAEALADQAVDNPDLAAILDEAIAAALGLDARSPKSEVQAAHRALEDAQDLLAEDEVEDEDPEVEDPEVEDPEVPEDPEVEVPETETVS